MGSDAGQENERPVHRVWVDAFELARMPGDATRNTRNFWPERSIAQPLHWEDAEFSHPEQPVVGVSWFDAVAYCEWLSAAPRAMLPFAHRSRMGTRGARRHWNRSCIPGATSRRSRCRIIQRDGRTDPSRWDSAENETRTGFATSARTCTSGARIGFSAEYYALRRSANPQGPEQGTAAKFARRIMAALHQSFALRRAVEHPSRISICRLWVSDCAGRDEGARLKGRWTNLSIRR